MENNKDFELLTPAYFQPDKGFKGIDNEFRVLSEGPVKPWFFKEEVGYFTNTNLLLYCHAGHIRLKINLAEYVVQEGGLLFVLPHLLFQVTEQSPEVKLEVVAFSFDFISSIKLPNGISEYVAQIEHNPLHGLDRHQCSELGMFIQLLRLQFSRDEPFTKEVVSELFIAFIYKITGWFLNTNAFRNDTGMSRQHRIHRSFISYLLKHFKTERRLSFYAGKLNLTPKYLSRVVLSVSGQRPSEWVQEITITSAKSMLKGSELTVSQVACELNFPNASFFGNYFKKNTGMTPLEYRNR